MEIMSEEKAEERRREHWKLLSSLKTTVEGLVSSSNPNVWSRYGGLHRLHKDMSHILSHGLKHEQVYYKQKDYWPFVWRVRYVSPHLASHVEQFSKLEPVLSSGLQSVGEGYKAERWLLHSLQVHLLSAQLRPLLKHQGHTSKYYNAVHSNVLSVHGGLLKSQSSGCFCRGAGGGWRSGEGVRVPQRASGAPWGCVGPRSEGDGERGMSPPPGPSVVVPSIALTEPASPCPAHSDALDSGEGDYDDGPEYLAIGNLGHRGNRRDSQSSTPGGEPCGGESDGEIQVQSPGRSSLASVPPPTPRRSSFSEGQREPGRGGSRGHVRSMSDTGINSKHRHESLVAEDCRLEDYSPFSLRSSDASTPSSLYMESTFGGTELITVYLSERRTSQPCADLEKENAHFSISESLIAAIELMKCNLRRRVVVEDEEEGDDSDSEIQQLKQKIRLRRHQIQRTRLPPSQRLFHSTDSGCSRRSSQDSFHLSNSGSAEEVEECELKDGCEGQSLMTVSRSGLSLSHASLFSDADIKRGVTSSVRSFLRSESISPSFLQSNSAESVAMGLLRQFEGMQLPAASELDWLVPEQDAPQKLLPIPDSLPISPDDGEHADIYKLRIRVRGNLEWAPPRPQIIFNIHPAHKRKIVVAKQNYRCAGCGTRIDPDYIKRMRYCEYLGRYFCQCCHENAQAVVPGRVLRKWDFSKYYVSNFARDLLGKISGDPLFNPNDINSGLYKKNKALETVRVLRVQLFHMKNLFKTCRLARDVLDQFDSLPGHLTEDLHLFSLSDLNAVRNGELAPRLRELLKLGSAHVAGCVLCQAKGFVCEFCGNDKDIIFPFQLNKCTCCEECKACFHSKCFQAGKECPRCQRLAERRERMARKNMEEQEDKEEDEGGGS
nr:run domain Beclin-1-interacting and cysteine-rich domain-containing protein-like [Salvelinus alpinus]